MEECFLLEEDDPRKNASTCSKLLFLWMKGPIYRANKSNLQVTDICKCPTNLSSSHSGDYLEKIWNKELNTAKKKSVEPSLTMAIFRAYFFDYLVYGGMAFMNYVVIKGIQPIILSNLISLFVSKNYSTSDMVIYGGGIVILVTSSSFLLHHSVFGGRLLSMKIRVAISSLVYRKVLKLNQQSTSKIGAGQIINLLANDLARFDVAIQVFHFLWITPLQVLIILFVIWRQLGYSGLMGVLIMIVVIVPLEGFLGLLTTIYRKKAVAKTDYRIKMINEIFSGIEVIKMHVWEKCFESIIQKARQEELKYIRKTAYIKGILSTFMFGTDRLCLSVSVLWYSLMGFHVKSDLVFFLSICFRVLQYSLGTMFPAAITIGSELLVSIDRLETFLTMEERKTEVPLPLGNEKGGNVQLDNVTASWKEKLLTLKSITLNFPSGSLSAIVGPVGAGKSSLLKLLIQELPKISGSMKVNGNISYSSQNPWIYRGSIKRNIIFNQVMKDSHYRNVIRVCGLETDLQQFPNGDETIVGSRGVSLSGGQKARINLARAIYKEADIYLLDDVLSALDARIGKYVFEECILKFLYGKTRVFVTHNLQYLKKADHITILNKKLMELSKNFLVEI